MNDVQSFNLARTKNRPCGIGDLVYPPTVLAFINNRVFPADVLFIRREYTVGARERAMFATPASVEVDGWIEPH